MNAILIIHADKRHELRADKPNGTLLMTCYDAQSAMLKASELGAKLIAPKTLKRHTYATG